ncbi:MAG: hypothetical protein CMP23_03190 [Rickettsiales bacterium]|nr:hypothetical protein [Rickettsiales bacterium]
MKRPPYSLLLGSFLCLTLAPSKARSYGEGTGAGPSLEERAVHLFSDRLRVDPDATDSSFSDFPAVRPLVYNPDLAEAARFHAEDMAVNDCFQHQSCDGTEFAARLQRFYEGIAFGENIALGSPDAETVVFDGWLYSPPHRDNMLLPDWRELGIGFAVNDIGQPLWVQNFGDRVEVDEPITTSATHWPLRGSLNQALDFYLAIYDPQGAPQGAELHLHDQVLEMNLDRGSDGMETWTVQSELVDEGCPEYFFVVTRETGETVSYPSSGSLTVPIDDAECEPWTETRKATAETATGCPASGQESRVSGRGCASSPDDAAGPGENLDRGDDYASCAVVPGSQGGNWTLVLAGWVLMQRRRRGQGR